MKRAALFFSISIAAAGGLVSCGGGSSDAAPVPNPSTPAPPPGAPTPPPPSAPPSTEVPTLTRTTIVSGLQNPWDLAFTPDGTMLFTEKCRGLSARLANGTTVRLFGTAGSSLVAPDLFCEGQSGVHGVAVDPEAAHRPAVRRDPNEHELDESGLREDKRQDRLPPAAGAEARDPLTRRGHADATSRPLSRACGGT